jgi:ArsR family transcriptional regulator, arsenate/arsenite/antimonite-responsive transcriptional repressor
MSARDISIDDRRLTLINKALADPMRFQMLERIAQSEKSPTCSCLRDWTGLAAATVSHHLKELEEAGLIHIERCGKFAHIALKRDVWRAYVKRLSAL